MAKLAQLFLSILAALLGLALTGHGSSGPRDIRLSSLP